MNRELRRQARTAVLKESARWPVTCVEIPRSEWNPNVLNHPRAPTRAWRSRDFLVQEFPAEGPAIVRLSVNVTALDGQRWKDGIPWDDLQRLKAEAGYPMHDAVEVFPRATDVVNVANMRHIWILPKPICGWRRKA